MSKWLGQVLHDLLMTRLTAEDPASDDTTSIMLQTMHDLVAQDRATARSDFDELDAAWQHDVPDPAYSRNQSTETEDDTSVDLPWDTDFDWEEEADLAAEQAPEVSRTADSHQSQTPPPAVEPPPPGWYTAPDGSGVQQWWTGVAWGPKAP